MIGHQWAAAILQQHIRSGSVRHAYLFTGPDHVGKSTMAIRFAQAINCRESAASGEPCGACRNCSLIAGQQHPDLHVLQREEGRTSIRIEQVRQLQYSLSLAPYEADRRIALLPEFHDATYHAWNALLKTLEEPSERVVLLLTAPSTDMLLPTIVSRCEVIPLRQVETSLIEAALQAAAPGSALRSTAARLAMGCPGLAFDYLQEDRMDEQIGFRQDLFDWLQMGTAERMKKLEEWMNWRSSFSERQDRVKQLFESWVVLWRDMLQVHYQQPGVVHLDARRVLLEITNLLEPDVVLDQLQRLEQARDELLANADPRLLLETLVLGFPRIPAFAI